MQLKQTDNVRPPASPLAPKTSPTVPREASSPSKHREITTLRRMHALMSTVNAGQDLQSVLQTVATGISDVGFKVASISLLRSDGTLEVVAVGGDDDARDALLGNRTPLRELQREFEVADHWGIARFVPHDRVPGDVPLGWVPDYEPLDVPDAWHPLDALFVPLNDPSGEFAGMLSVDMPHDGRRPGQFQREILEMYAVQAANAVTNAEHRHRLTEQVRLAEATRAVMQATGGELDLDQIIANCLPPLKEGFRAAGVWIRVFAGGEGLAGAYSTTHTEQDDAVPEAIRELATRAAYACWPEQRSVVISDKAPAPSDIVSAEQAILQQQLIGELGAQSLLFAPLGAGREALGYLVLTRAEGAVDWSDEDLDAALEIGRDLGRVVLHARLFTRERHLVSQLQDLDRYKTDLIATISHELKNPLTSILGHAEMLRGARDDTARERSLAAVERNSDRLADLVDDLLLLSKVGDPHRPIITAPVDLGRLTTEAIDMLRIQAEQRGVEVRLAPVGEPAIALGDRGELDRVVVNLLSNAIKYTPSGREVDVAVVTRGGEAVLSVSDQGIGISEPDQERLFTEFYRSSNPVAHALPGTGLGLTIVQRIMDRHRGTIEVRSTLGEGSTFTVRLPSAAAH